MDLVGDALDFSSSSPKSDNANAEQKIADAAQDNADARQLKADAAEEAAEAAGE
jgi:hypothetical protein